MSQFIDRRKNGKKKSTINRQRFLRRYKQQIKKAVSDAMGKRSIKEMDKGEQVTIPARDLTEPRFEWDPADKRGFVLPGNDRFVENDTIPKPADADDSGGNSASNDKNVSEDEFVFQLSREEFLELYFEDLELPLLIKKELSGLKVSKSVRGGITTSGIPTNINILRSMRQAVSRRLALSSRLKEKLIEKEKEVAEEKTPDSEPAKILQEELERLQRRIKKIPFIDPLDLRYNSKVQVEEPVSQAVMFCIMDVSGSMDENKKEIAKRFFILLYLFLKRNYENIELVFIRHHTSAKEVNEEEFFYSRETGGTVVSSALLLLKQLIEKRFSPKVWNIYVAQASDGDNWNADSPYCGELLNEGILPFLQYFAYIEITPRHHQSLWEIYQKIRERHPHFAMENIDTLADIYPVFRELFKRKTG